MTSGEAMAPRTPESTEPSGPAPGLGSRAGLDEPTEAVTAWLGRAGRVGWVARGVVLVLVGLLAVPIALGDGRRTDEEASRTGAIETIADHSVGGILLVATAAGLLLYALWRAAAGLLRDGDDEAAPITWAHRAADLGSAVLHAALAWSALSFALTDSDPDRAGGQSTLETATRVLMERWWGRWALGIGALVGLAVAGRFAVRAWRGEVTDELDLTAASRRERSTLEALGTVGWVGRSIVTALLSIFVFTAAWSADPSDAKGLDEVLHETSGSWWGAVLVFVAGVALVAYGCFAALGARRRRLQGTRG